MVYQLIICRQIFFTPLSEFNLNILYKKTMTEFVISHCLIYIHTHCSLYPLSRNLS
nr:MAG TPA: hypothetical protein [Caudoviricetes sp.]